MKKLLGAILLSPIFALAAGTVEIKSDDYMTTMNIQVSSSKNISVECYGETGKAQSQFGALPRLVGAANVTVLDVSAEGSAVKVMLSINNLKKSVTIPIAPGCSISE